MTRVRLVLALALTAVPALACAQYKCKDERGRTQYLSQPRPGCTDMSGKPVDAPQKAAPAAAPAAKYALPATLAPRAKSAPPPGPRQAPVLGALPADPDQRKIDCRGLQQQLDWLNGPDGSKAENQGARVAMVQQAMRGCK